MVDFNNKNKEFFDKIEEFMHILDDWVDENLNFDENGQKVKAKRPPRMGIEMFKNQDQATEIESPFRKKKTGLQKLDFSKDKLNSCEQVEESKEIQKKLDEQYQTIMKNFGKRKDEFEQLKLKSQSELYQMHQSGELQRMTKEWQKELELQLIGDEHTSHENAGQAITEFMQENNQSFKEIESFMHILNDWLEETSTAHGTDSQ